MKRQWLSVVWGLGCALGLLAALHLGLASPASADPIILYVAPPPVGSDSNACSESAPCATIHRAAGLAVSGNEIRVAQGVYSDIHSTGSVTQVLYLNKTITVCG
ncbi:MAG TPA: hypothetical protein PKH77_25095, partial [Anaerolineae bacterium]|nr:hypothetical protein [Anaerolineae bacterium]